MKKRKHTEQRGNDDQWSEKQPLTSERPKAPERKFRSRYAPPPRINPVYQDPESAAPRRDDPRFAGGRKINPVYQHPDDEAKKKSQKFHPNKVQHARPEFRKPKHAGHAGPKHGHDKHGSRDDRKRPPKGEFRRHDKPHGQQGGPSHHPRGPKPQHQHPKQHPAPPAPAPAAVQAPPQAAPALPQGRQRGELPLNMVGGRNPVLEALRSETTPIEKVIFHAGASGGAMDKIRQAAKQRGVVYTEMRKQKFRELTNDAMTQGVIAIVGIKEYVGVTDILSAAQAKDEKPCLLILDEIEDPHNLGALIRTAECAGVHGVVIPKHHSASINQTVAKTSAGASEHMPVAKVVNIAQTIDALKEEGFWIIGTDDSAEKSYTEVDLTGPVAIVIGNEGKGMRQLVREKCDHLVKIPLLGKIGSLNASVAGALVMYEVVRKRRGL